MRKIKRRHFQLLEVMIAVFLVVACALPALNAYVNMNKVQSDQVRLHQRDHLVHLLYSQLVEDLYRNRIQWADIQEGKQSELDEDLCKDVYDQFKKHSYQCFYRLSKRQSKEENDPNQPNHYLIQLDITIKDLLRAQDQANHVDYQYWAYVQKKK